MSFVLGCCGGDRKKKNKKREKSMSLYTDRDETVNIGEIPIKTTNQEKLKHHKDGDVSSSSQIRVEDKNGSAKVANSEDHPDVKQDAENHVKKEKGKKSSRKSSRKSSSSSSPLGSNHRNDQITYPDGNRESSPAEDESFPAITPTSDEQGASPRSARSNVETMKESEISINSAEHSRSDETLTSTTVTLDDSTRTEQLTTNQTIEYTQSHVEETSQLPTSSYSEDKAIHDNPTILLVATEETSINANDVVTSQETMSSKNSFGSKKSIDSSLSSSSSSESEDEVTSRSLKESGVSKPKQEEKRSEEVFHSTTDQQKDFDNMEQEENNSNEDVLSSKTISQTNQDQLSDVDSAMKGNLLEDKSTRSSKRSHKKRVAKKRREDIVFTSGWRKKVYLVDLLRAKLLSEKTVEDLEDGSIDEEQVSADLHQYLCGKEPIAGIMKMETGEKMSLNDASKAATIRRGTAVNLLEAQAATGSIINPYTGEKLDVEEAIKQSLVDKVVSSALLRAERAVFGYKSRISAEPLSLFEAMKRNLIVQSHGIRLLEAQIATGGIIDPAVNHRIPLDLALERGLFDETLNEKILEDASDDTKGFFDPNTNENLTYLQLMQRCITDEVTSFLLLPIYKKKQKKDYWKN